MVLSRRRARALAGSDTSTPASSAARAYASVVITNPSGTGKPARTSSPRLAPLPPAIETSAAHTSRSARISGALIGGPGCGGRSAASLWAGGWPPSVLEILERSPQISRSSPTLIGSPRLAATRAPPDSLQNLDAVIGDLLCHRGIRDVEQARHLRAVPARVLKQPLDVELLHLGQSWRPALAELSGE